MKSGIRNTLFRTVVDSPLGAIALESDGQLLTGLCFDTSIQGVESGFVDGVSLPIFDMTRRWIDIYFSGCNPVFMPPFVMRGTEFSMAVWRKLIEIPYGRTVTYGELARKVGCRSAQAVGRAVGQNKILLVVPCHRVIGANGMLTGYSGGLERKRRLLDLENC